MIWNTWNLDDARIAGRSSSGLIQTDAGGPNVNVVSESHVHGALCVHCTKEYESKYTTQKSIELKSTVLQAQKGFACVYAWSC